MRKFILLFMLFPVLSGFSQEKITLIGKVRDTAENKDLSNASVSLLRAKDSILVTSVRTDIQGKFLIQVNDFSTYLIMVTYPKYADFMDKVSIKLGNNDLGMIPLNTTYYLLKEVIIKSPNAAIRMKGDTTEYRADSFRVAPNADVQELLRKMPGIQVNSKGEITAQGEKVNKVLVDGEEFFSDDPGVVTKNLRADIVERVQVFDKKSDQAAFTGIDDGEKSKTINLQLKDEKKKGYFGKIEAGSSIGNYRSGKVMANHFKNKLKLSGYVTTDNTQFEGLNWDEARNYSGNSNTVTDIGDDGSISVYYSGDDDYEENKGLPNQQTGGLFFGNKWNNTNTSNEIQYQRLATELSGINYAKTILNNSSLSSFTNLTQQLNKRRLKVASTNEFGTDSTGSFKVVVKASNLIKDASAYYEGQTSDDSNNPVNRSIRSTSGNENLKSLSSNLSYKKKFEKKGRTISIVSEIQINDKIQNGLLNSRNNLFGYNGDLGRLEVIDQKKESMMNNKSLNTTVVYTEPIGKKSFILFKFNNRIGTNDAERYTYGNNGLGVYNQLVDSLSNHFIFNNFNNNGSVSYRYIAKKMNFIVNGGFGGVVYKLNDIELAKNRQIAFTNILPSLSFNLTPRQQRKIRFDYNGNTVNPTLAQIQPIVDNIDPLNINIGNADLKQGFRHTLTMNASDFKILKGRSMTIYNSFSATSNDITRSSVIDQYGRTASKFLNVNGNFNNYLAGGYYKEIFKSFNAGMRLSFTYNRYINYINNVRNVNNNRSLSYSIDLNYFPDKWFEFYTYFTIGNNYISSTINKMANTNYLSFSQYGNFIFKFKKAKTFINISSNALVYQKTAYFPTQQNVILIHPSVRKILTKNDALEAKILVYDIFNKNKDILRNINTNFISENYNNSIRRYILFSLIYNFSKNGKPSSF